MHPIGVVLHRRVDELLDLGEGHDLIKLAVNLRLLHPQDGAIQVDVLSPRQFGVEAGAHLQQAADPTMDLSLPLCRLGDPRKDFEQRALPCTVAADDADDFAVLDFEGDVLESPNVFRLRIADCGLPRSRRKGEAKASVMTSRRAL